MSTLLPIWSSSPLDQFTTRNLFSLKADLLGNFQISLTNIGLYLIIATIIIFMFYTLATNYEFTTPNGWSLSMKSIYATVQRYLTFNPPKPHAFIERELLSSMVYATAGTTTVGLMAIIARNSAYLFTAGIILNTFYQTVGLLSPFLISIMEHIIQDIMETYTRISIEYSGPGLSQETLRHIHAYLTPYLRSYHSIFSLLRTIVGFFAGSPELNQMQDLYTRFLVAGQTLMSLYRDVERTLRIPLANSPISTQVWGF